MTYVGLSLKGNNGSNTPKRPVFQESPYKSQEEAQSDPDRNRRQICASTSLGTSSEYKADTSNAQDNRLYLKSF